MFLKTYLAIILYGFLPNYVACISLIEDEHIKLMPQIFRLDDFQKCSSDGKIFCNLEIKLNPLDSKNPSELWKSIEITKTSPYYFTHTDLFYGLCVNNDSVKISKATLNKMAISERKVEKYEKLGLTAEVVKYECFKDFGHKYEVRLYDVVFLIASILYILLILVSTVLHLKGQTAHNKYLMAFSLKKNLLKVKHSYLRSNNNDLDCIQGLRVCITLCISIVHIIIGVYIGYISNTEVVEKNFQTWIFFFSSKMTGFGVQPFFLISAFFLSYQSWNFFKNQADLNTFKYFWFACIYRYLRIIPLLACVVAFCKSVWYYRWFNMAQPTSRYARDHFDNCQKHWWTSLIFVQNVYKPNEMCFPSAWYLSADMQLFAISTIILIVFWKFKTNLKALFAALFLFSVVIFGIKTYINEFDILMKVFPESLKFFSLLRDREFLFAYIGTWSSFPIYVMGLGMGLWYFKIKSGQISNEFFKNNNWGVYFIVLPLSAICLSCLEPQLGGIAKAFIASCVRPLYILGFLVGILGMSQTPTSLLRRILGSKPMMFVGNFAYSLYIANSIILCADSQNHMVNISLYNILHHVLLYTIYMFILTFFLHILVEIPFSELQDQLMAQPKFQKKKHSQ